MPGGTGRGVVGDLPGVRQPDQHVRLFPPVADLPGQAQRALVTADRAGELPQAPPDVPEVVPGVRLAQHVAQFPVQPQHPAAERQRLLVVTELGGLPGQIRQRIGVVGPVAQPLVQPQRLPGVAACLLVAALASGRDAEQDAGAGLAGTVAAVREACAPTAIFNPNLGGVDVTNIWLSGG